MSEQQIQPVSVSGNPHTIVDQITHAQALMAMIDGVRAAARSWRDSMRDDALAGEVCLFCETSYASRMSEPCWQGDAGHQFEEGLVEAWAAQVLENDPPVSIRVDLVAVDAAMALLDGENWLLK